MTQFIFVLDFTYNGQKVFALELGDFFKSGLSGLNRLRKLQDQIPVEEEYANTLRLRYPEAIYLKDESVTDFFYTNALIFHDFSKQVQARCNFKNRNLIPELLYSRAMLGAETVYEKPLIATLQGSIPPHFRPSFTTLQKNQKNTFEILNYPQGVLADACQDKVIFHRFTDQTGFCPNTLLVDLHDLDLTNVIHFLEQNHSTQYVIKPTNMSRGRGVEILNASQVINFIQTLQKIAKFEPISFKNAQDRNNFSIWEHVILDKNNYFLLLQTCCPSKEIYYEGDPYRPTGRVVVEATFSDELDTLPSLKFLGHYWKFPAKKADHMTTASLVSHVEDNAPVAAIHADDWEIIERDLQTYLPSVLLQLYSTDFSKLSQQFEDSSAFKRYQEVLGINKISTEQIPQLSDPENYFEQFTYGGPGFNEHLPHFQKAVCLSSISLEEEAISKEEKELISKETPISDSVSGNLHFFSHNIEDSHSQTKSTKSFECQIF